MGSKTGAPEEEPRRWVLVEPFALAPAPVTRGEWTLFIDQTAYETSAEAEGGGFGLTAQGYFGYFKDLSWRSPGFAQSDDDPVVLVSWFDAVAYCNWLSVREGLVPCYSVKGETDFGLWPSRWNQRRTLAVVRDPSASGYRLPTEAEWEWAASGGGDWDFPWGNGPSSPGGHPRANLAGREFSERFFDGVVWKDHRDPYVYTSPVRTFEASPLGLWDMGGNAQQYCDDGDTRQGQPGKRVTKGSSWNAGPRLGTVSSRSSSFPEERSSLVGFRLARNAGP